MTVDEMIEAIRENMEYDLEGMRVSESIVAVIRAGQQMRKTIGPLMPHGHAIYIACEAWDMAVGEKE